MNASSEASDVVFSVQENSYHAYNNVLHLRFVKLYEIAMEYDNDGPIPIFFVTGEIFKSILDFAYGVRTPDIENLDVATEKLVAADRFECVHLKLYVELFPLPFT